MGPTTVAVAGALIENGRVRVARGGLYRNWGSGGRRVRAIRCAAWVRVKVRRPHLTTTDNDVVDGFDLNDPGGVFSPSRVISIREPVAWGVGHYGLTQGRAWLGETRIRSAAVLNGVPVNATQDSHPIITRRCSQFGWRRGIFWSCANV